MNLKGGLGAHICDGVLIKRDGDARAHIAAAGPRAGRKVRVFWWDLHLPAVCIVGSAAVVWGVFVRCLKAVAAFAGPVFLPFVFEFRA